MARTSLRFHDKLAWYAANPEPGDWLWLIIYHTLHWLPRMFLIAFSTNEMAIADCYRGFCLPGMVLTACSTAGMAVADIRVRTRLHVYFRWAFLFCKTCAAWLVLDIPLLFWRIEDTAEVWRSFCPGIDDEALGYGHWLSMISITLCWSWLWVVSMSTVEHMDKEHLHPHQRIGQRGRGRED
ncbi:hypothetical protein MMC08_007547 [Hypocenomyce scalaris]|nr:hypothetical protein [Hypocenomyce scalaris]